MYMCTYTYSYTCILCDDPVCPDPVFEAVNRTLVTFRIAEGNRNIT